MNTKLTAKQIEQQLAEIDKKLKNRVAQAKSYVKENALKFLKLYSWQKDLRELITKKNIVLFTYATGNKCYSKEFWLEFYKKINEEFQNSYNIIEVLPVENISQLNFSIPTFYSKDIIEIAAFFHNVEVFIGADSGMMHLAATATKTIGLFKNDTKMEIYQPFGNTNLGINTSKKSIEDCIAIVKTSLSL